MVSPNHDDHDPEYDDIPPPVDESEESLKQYYMQQQQKRIKSNQYKLERALLLDSKIQVFISTQTQNFWALKFLIESDDSLASIRTNTNGTLLICAAATRGMSIRFFEFVIGLTIDRCSINSVDENGQNALMHCLIIQNYHLVDTLLLCGADPISIDSSGKTVLQYAAETANFSIIQKFIQTIAQPYSKDEINDKILLCQKSTLQTYQAPVIMDRSSVIIKGEDTTKIKERMSKSKLLDKKKSKSKME